MASVPNPTVQPFRFLDLPGELQNRVLSLTLDANELSTVTMDASSYKHLLLPVSDVDDALSTTVTSQVPYEPGYYSPWRIFDGLRETPEIPARCQEDLIARSNPPAITQVNRKIRRDAMTLYFRDHLALEMQDRAAWLEYDSSHQIGLLDKWIGSMKEHGHGDLVASIRRLSVAVNHEYTLDAKYSKIIPTLQELVRHPQFADEVRLRGAYTIFQLERSDSKVVVRAGCTLHENTRAAIQAKLDSVLNSCWASGYSGEDLLDMAKWLQGYADGDRLTLLPRTEECFTANGTDYYVKYETWSVVATSERSQLKAN